MAILRSVAKTDTFEKQRQTINSIGQDLFDLSSGSASQTFGSVLLADGTHSAPSLAYSNESNLGFYRKTLGVLGVVSADSDVVNFSSTESVYFTNLSLRKYYLQTTDVTITSGGTGYSPSTFFAVPLLGGSGTGATADITVVDWTSTTTSAGNSYTPGTYNAIKIRTVSGSGSGATATVVVDDNGNVTSFTPVVYGSGYTQGTVLGLFPQRTGVSTTLTNGSDSITVNTTSDIVTGSAVTVTGGTGTIGAGTTVLAIIDDTTLLLSGAATGDGAATLTFVPPYGNGSGFTRTINALNTVSAVTIISGGNGYAQGDTLSVASASLSLPISVTVSDISVQVVTFTGTLPSSTFSVGDTLEDSGGGSPYEIVQVITSGGNISSVVVDGSNFVDAQTLVITGNATVYTVNTATDSFRAGIDLGDGNGVQYAPSLTLYEGSTYEFTYSASNPFALSTTQDGPTEYLPTTIVRDTQNAKLTVAVTDTFPSTLYYYSTAGAGYGGASTVTINPNNPNPPGSGFQLLANTVSILDSVACNIIDGRVTALDVVTTTLTATTGTVTTLTSTTADLTTSRLGTVTDRGSGITVTTGGTTNFTVTPGNNFNVGTLFSVQSSTGNLTTTGVVKTTGSFNSNDLLTISSNTISSLGTSDIILAPIANTNAKVSGTMSFVIPSGTIDQRPQGAKAESGSIRFNTETQQYEGYNGIAAAWSSLGGVRDVDGNTYIVAEEFTGANDNTFWFYNGGTNSLTISQSTINLKSAHTFTSTDVSAYTAWQGNTYYPLGELLYSGPNVYEVTVAGLSDTASPSHTSGAVIANNGTPTILGAIAEYTVSTPSGGNSAGVYSYDDPYGLAQFQLTFALGVVDVVILSQGTGGYTTSGGGVDNVITIPGSSIGGADGVDDITITVTAIAAAIELTWYGTTSGNIIFDGVKEVQYNDSPIKVSDSTTGNSLTFTGQSIVTSGQLTVDLPEGSNFVIDATSSLAIPVGDNLQRGTPAPGSIRFNSETNQYEGYNSGAGNWSSLGGVRDVDGNTYIIPETSAGSNENILYFYNNDDNTLQVKQTEVQFETIDTITSTSNILNLNVENITFNDLSAGLDFSDETRSVFYSSVNSLDLALSTGLSIDTVLRLSNAGEIILNKTFGTGTFTGVKFLDPFLKSFELDDLQIKTDDIILTKGTTDTATALVYDPVLFKSSTVTITAHNSTTDDVHTEEINIICKGTDIYTVEYGTNKTLNLFDVSVDFNASNNVRLTLSLDTNLTSGDVVNITVVRNNIKK